jgi:hypothetical protein
LVQAVRHWRPYLWGCHFLLHTDHYSLNFLLDQRLSTVPQHQWVSKLFGFGFAMEYRPGRLNTVADALSRRDAEAAPEADGTTAVAALSGSSFAYLDDVLSATTAAPDTQLLLERLRAGELAAPWREDAGLLLHGTRIFVLDFGDLCHQALQLAHGASHKGVQKTLHRLRSDFYIPGDCSMVQDWVQT